MSPTRARPVNFLLAGLLASSTLAAQPNPPAGGPTAPAPSAGAGHREPTGVPNVQISFEFRGGKFGEFVDAVCAAAAPVPINVLLPSDVGHIEAPALSLRQVGVMTAFSVMVEQINESLRPASALNMSQPLTGPGEAITVRFSTIRLDPRPSWGSPRTTRVFAVRDIVEPPLDLAGQQGTFFPLDDLMGAINTAIQLGIAPDRPGPELVLHKESMTLACRATAEQQVVIEDVLGRLRETVEPRRRQLIQQAERDREAAVQRAAADAEFEQARIQQERAAREFEAVETRRKQVEQLAEAGHTSVFERDQARQAAAAAEAGLREATAKRNAAEKRRSLLPEAMPSAAAVSQICYNFAPVGEPDASMAAVIRHLAVDMPPRVAAAEVKPAGTWLVVQTTRARHDTIRGVINAALAQQTGRPDFDVERSTDPHAPATAPAPR